MANVEVQTQEGGQGDKNGGPPVSGKVCPYYAWANHGSYCSYYSQRCSDGMWVNLNAECDLNVPATCPDHESCKPSPFYRVSYKSRPQPPHHVTDDLGGTGIPGKLPSGYIPWKQPGVTFLDQAAHVAPPFRQGIFARFNKPADGRPVIARLYLALIEPVHFDPPGSGKPPLIVGVGTEVSAAIPGFPIHTPDHVDEIAPNAFIVWLGEQPYLVITHHV